MPLRLDITSEEDTASAADTLERETGSEGLYGLVNNAGIVVPGPLEFIPIDAFRQQIEVNVVAQLAVTQAFMPALRRARGRVVFIGSISGLFALPLAGAYAASKYALEAVSDALRMELRAFGMPVVIIEPGQIHTPIWETSLARGDELYRNAPPELETYYGGPLRGLRRRVKRGMRALPADRVAKVVERALTVRSPRARYIVGAEARLRAILKKVLPDSTRDAIVAKALARL